MCILFISFQRLVCIDCHDCMPDLYDLYICLHRDCFKIVCSQKVNDHAALHNKVRLIHVKFMSFRSNFYFDVYARNFTKNDKLIFTNNDYFKYLV